MARRGTELREHILAEAKNVFLELGYERTSMDLVAQCAHTSKRSLYAHFETKDALFTAVVERIQELFTGRIKTPEHYADDPLDATVLFCGRFAQMLTWAPILRTCRLGITEAERLPDASSRLYDAFFGAAQGRLSSFLSQRFDLDDDTANREADRCLAHAIHPWLPRALFGLEALHEDVPDEEAVAADVDLASIRATVVAVLSAGDSASGP